VDLRRKSFEVLRYLVEHAGRVVTKEEVLEAVWPDVTVSDDSLIQCISEVRSAIGDRSHQIIKTVPRRGYLLNGNLTRPSGNIVNPPVVAGDRRPSLVVLPFQHLADDPEQAYFADGLTEDLTVGLSRFGAPVIARGTAFTYKGKPIDARKVGRELGVRYVIDGSVRRSKNLVRVTAELVDASTAVNICMESFDIDWRDVTRLRDEVAARLANFFDVGLVRAESARSRERPNDPEAWDLMMGARAAYHRALRGGDWSEPRRLFREALQRDESLAGAWRGLCHTYLPNARFSATRDQDLLQAEESAERAMALDRGAWSHLVRGWLRFEQKRSEQALPELEQALQLNPNLAFGHVMMARVNIVQGRPAYALERLQKAMRLSPNDPGLPYWQTGMGVAYLSVQEDLEALKWLNKSLALNPRLHFTRLYQASARALCGHDAQAETELAELLHLHPDWTVSRLEALELSQEPAFRAQQKRIYEGLRRAGLGQ
jgi:TolB-like protein/Tfp pilus assembly protein PilF